MSKLTIDLDLIDISLNKITTDLQKSSIKNEYDYGFKTPSRRITKRNTPPSIKKEYVEARLKRSRSVIENLNELDNNSEIEDDNNKIRRITFSSLESNN